MTKCTYIYTFYTLYVYVCVYVCVCIYIYIYIYNFNLSTYLSNFPVQFILILWVSVCWIIIPIKSFNERCFSRAFFYWKVSVLHTQVVSPSWILRICVHLVHTLATLSRLSIICNTFSLLLLQILHCTYILSA